MEEENIKRNKGTGEGVSFRRKRSGITRVQRTWKSYASLNHEWGVYWTFCHKTGGADGPHCMVSPLFGNITVGPRTPVTLSAL